MLLEEMRFATFSSRCMGSVDEHAMFGGSAFVGLVVWHSLSLFSWYSSSFHSSIRLAGCFSSVFWLSVTYFEISCACMV
jgi:hypothetical protein